MTATSWRYFLSFIIILTGFSTLHQSTQTFRRTCWFKLVQRRMCREQWSGEEEIEKYYFFARTCDTWTHEKMTKWFKNSQFSLQNILFHGISNVKMCFKLTLLQQISGIFNDPLFPYSLEIVLGNSLSICVEFVGKFKPDDKTVAGLDSNITKQYIFHSDLWTWPVLKFVYDFVIILFYFRIYRASLTRINKLFTPSLLSYLCICCKIISVCDKLKMKDEWLTETSSSYSQLIIISILFEGWTWNNSFIPRPGPSVWSPPPCIWSTWLRLIHTSCHDASIDSRHPVLYISVFTRIKHPAAGENNFYT